MSADTDHRHVSIRLAAEPASAAAARRFITTALDDWDAADLGDRAMLVADELVTNAILHAGGGPIDVAIVLHDDRLRIEVRDSLPRLPTPSARPPGAELAFGRGLHLVEAVTVDWGARPTEEGKVVWAELSR